MESFGAPVMLCAAILLHVSRFAMLLSAANGRHTSAAYNQSRLCKVFWSQWHSCSSLYWPELGEFGYVSEASCRPSVCGS